MQNTTQKKVKQGSLCSEQFMDSNGLQGVLGYTFGLQGKWSFRTECTSGWFLIDSTL